MRLTIPLRHVALLVIALTVSLVHGSAYAGGRHPVAVVAEDLDGDPGCVGCPDIAVADKGLRAISVRFGNGDGTFGTPVNLALTGAAIAVALGDCDGDGDTDVIASSAGGRISVFRNQQAQASPQTFVEAAGSPIVLGGKVAFLVARDGTGAPLDINGDGKADLAVVSNAKTVLTLLGDGACGFAAPAAAGEAVSRIVGLAAGDFDAANGVDLAYADTFGSRAVMLVNDGTGTFPTKQETFLGGGPTSLLGTDLEPNGVPDLVATQTKNTGVGTQLGVNVVHGNAGFGLSAANQYGSGGKNPVAAVVGNFDAGAPVDIVVANRKTATLGFLAGTGGANFTQAVTSPLGGKNPISLAAGDFDGDGNLDVVVVLRSGGTVALCKGDGTGSFTCAPIS